MGDAAADAGEDGPAEEAAPPVLDDEELRELAEVVAAVSIAPLGRNYFERYRDVRDAVREMSREVEGGVSGEELASRLDEEDYEVLEVIVRNLDNFAEQGFHRQGKVEPYTSARRDADRLEPFLELLKPHLAG